MGNENIKFFKEDILKINNRELREVVVDILKNQDDVNCLKPSSSTGKYHAAEDNGKYGNGIHCKKVAYCAMRIIQCIPKYDSNIHKDIVFVSALLHDMAKYDNKDSKYTNFLHPQKMADIVRSYKSSHKNIEKVLENIATNIASHMSRWNQSNFSKGTLELPQTREQYIICFADMIAADKNIRINKNVL